MLIEKHRSVNLYQAQLIIIMTQSMQLHYVNIDSLLFSTQASQKSDLILSSSPIDSTYTHTSNLLCSHLYPLLSADDLSVLSAFRHSYLQSSKFQTTFLTDLLLHASLKDRKQKKLHMLSTNLEVMCSILGTNIQNSVINAVLITVDEDQ